MQLYAVEVVRCSSEKSYSVQLYMVIHLNLVFIVEVNWLKSVCSRCLGFSLTVQ